MTEIRETMRGVVLTGHGGLEKLELRDDLPVPAPGRGEVLVRIAAAAVNNTDVNTRVAWYSKNQGADDDASWAGAPIAFPRIQGIDGCGHVSAVGEGVDPARVGERVLIEPCIREAKGETLARPWFFGSECDGAFAEYAVVAARHAFPVDSTLGDAELASFPCSYSTAENMLPRADLAARETVLVTGASGGVGSAAVQLARARDARVIAVTQPEKAEELRALGAEHILFREEDPLEVLGGESVDLVVDLVGGAGWPPLLEVLRPGGRYAVAGAVAGPLVELDLRSLYLKDLTLYGCTVLGEGVFASLVDHIEQGRIAPLVAARYPLERLAEAQTAFLEKRHTGKIAIEVAEPA